ncbi:hypothetical protein RJ55_07506 [Drechmeria coniospora]|nr:hypothetical protein RJ55_07506 [Drechmeria coniospora]
MATSAAAAAAVMSGPVPGPVPSPAPARAAPRQHPAALIALESPERRRAFEFYRRCAVPVLDGISGGDFWGGVVLRLSLTEPVVRHALLAVSGFMEFAMAADSSRHLQQRNAGFQEYGKAIFALRTWDSESRSAVIPLLVCLLFTCIEFLLEQDAASQLHICQGRKILYDLCASHSFGLDMIRTELVPIYTRLSLASFFFGSRPVPIPRHLKGTKTIPSVLTSMTEARTHLYFLIDEALRFSTQAKPTIHTRAPAMGDLHVLGALQQDLLSRLSHWNTAFAVLATTCARPPNDLAAAAAAAQSLLRIYHLAAVVWTSTALQPHETAYDAHLAAFSSIVSHATFILRCRAPPSRLPSFTFETELIPPLYWTASKCRHPLLRRAALRLLMNDQLKDRRENLWHGQETIAVAARAIEMEETKLKLRQSVGVDAMPEPELDAVPPGLVDGHGLMPPTQPPGMATLALDRVARVRGEFDESSRQKRHPSVSSSPSTSIPVDSHTTVVTTAAMNDTRLHSPYGIPENRRIKIMTIGQREKDGVWITVVRYPKHGETSWNVIKELLRLPAVASNGGRVG